MCCFASFISAVLGYLVGAIPFGLVFTRMAGMGDIRLIGSGNIGATNVLRTGRKDLALLTLVCDLSKAGLIALFCRYAFESSLAGLMAGFFAVIGHNYPLWLRFKGGKGVAATLGMMLATVPVTGVFSICVWLVTALLFRYSSLAALTALCVAPASAFIMGNKPAGICYAFLAVLALIRHRSNISRLLNGTESRISFKGKKK